MNFKNKDIEKFSICNAIISRGAYMSSSYKYSNDSSILGIERINDDSYSDTDIVGVSVNGKRKGRLSFDKNLVKTALLSGAVIVKDNEYHTNRSFNIGEKELETFLLNMGAIKIANNRSRSLWRLPTNN